MKFIDNILFKRTPYDLKSLAELMQASYAIAPDEPEFIQKKTFSPSVIGYGHGQCPRYWPLVFRGGYFIFNFDHTSVDNMAVGTDAHRRIQKNFENSELDVECEKEITSENPPIRGFVDLIIRDYNGFTIPVEVKTTRMESFAIRKAKKIPPSYHELQILIYMYLLNEKYGLLLYENKNDHSKLLLPVEMTEENKQKVEAVFTWMKKVYQIYQKDQLPQIPYRKNSRVCKSCPIKAFCYSSPEGDIKVEPLNYEDIQSESGW